VRTKDLFYWIKERHAIFLKKETGAPAPWTKDTILQHYRFCNPYRENDKVTVWLRHNWRVPHDAAKDLWFAMVVARLVNWPSTLELMGYPVKGGKWHPAAFTKCLHARRAAGQQVFSGAYIVSTNGHAMDKAEYLATRVLQPLWDARKAAPQPGVATLAALQAWLTRFDGLGSFMAAQVVADIKYQSGWRNAADWATFAASGPGSKRGLNRVMGRPVDAPWREAEWHARLTELTAALAPMLAKAGMPPMHAQDVQNCNCEFDKYERVRLGEGKPRSTYPGGAL
jgi:hypothetical protein